MSIDSDRKMAYLQMFELTAWKEFKEFLNDEKRISIDKILVSEDMKEINLHRGVVNCINSIESHLEFVTK